MKKADDVIKDITKKSLASYGIEKDEQVPTPTVSTDLFAAPQSNHAIATRKYKTKKPVYTAPRRPVMSREEYLKRHPEAATPSVASKGKTDELLLACQELPTPDQPIKGYAGYSREEWDKLVTIIARYTADVAEGAGLLYKGGMFCPDNLRKGLSVLLQENFSHIDPYDKRRRSISVDGRIDTDERKP